MCGQGYWKGINKNIPISTVILTGIAQIWIMEYMDSKSIIHTFTTILYSIFKIMSTGGSL